jgi:biotin-[acetyl-CoA-carboxylase] ligase BirA-like protein
MHRSMRRTCKFATLALLSSRVSPFSPKSASHLRRIPTCSHRRGSSRMSTTTSGSEKQENEIIFSSEDLQVFHLKRTVDSTQEETKRFLEEHRRTDDRSLAVIADNQSKGRGTGGRSWVASEGNLYLTCAIPMDLIPLSKVTLLPLGVGVLVAERIAEYTRSRPTVKWPNDVLLENFKVGGTLIENYRAGQQDWWLIGIGVNIESHPLQLPPEKKDFHAAPRSATCLRDHAKGSTIPTAVELGLDLASGLQQWTSQIQKENASSVICTWKSWADMRSSYIIRETGESVTSVDLEIDGQLRVTGQDGIERLLVADYFY